MLSKSTIVFCDEGELCSVLDSLEQESSSFLCMMPDKAPQQGDLKKFLSHSSKKKVEPCE